MLCIANKSDNNPFDTTRFYYICIYTETTLHSEIRTDLTFSLISNLFQHPLPVLLQLPTPVLPCISNYLSLPHPSDKSVATLPKDTLSWALSTCESSSGVVGEHASYGNCRIRDIFPSIHSCCWRMEEKLQKSFLLLGRRGIRVERFISGVFTKWQWGFLCHYFRGKGRFIGWVLSGKKNSG